MSGPDGRRDAEAQILSVIEALPEELSREFEVSLTKLAQSATNPRHIEVLEELLASAADEDHAYAAFYCLNIIHRRNRDFTLLERLITAQEARFGVRPTFQHLKVLFTIDRGVGRRKEELIQWAYEDANANADNAGFVHLFADVVASLAEEADTEHERNVVDTWLDDAIAAANRAIRLDSRYAKYYATKARLLAFKGQYAESMELIHMAIDTEDSTRPDYAIRLGEYQSRRLWIQARRSDLVLAERSQGAADALQDRYNSLRDGLDSATEKIDESNVRNLQFLGFFAALISFTIASVQIAAAQPPNDAIRLIIVLTGGLLVAFSGFGVLLEGGRLGAPVRRIVLVGLIGAAVIAVGALL